MTLNSTDINPEINADFDDLIESNVVGKRLTRRLKRAYYNALARKCIKELSVDPLKVFGVEADRIIYNMSKADFSEIGEIKLGNKIYRVTEYDQIVSDLTKL
jgi:hypothetical protein